MTPSTFAPTTSSAAAPEAAAPSSHRLRSAFMGVWTAVGVILLTAALIFLLNILSLPVSILIWTAVFVFCLRGMVNKLERHGVNRAIGTTLAYVAMFVAVAVIGLLLFSPVFGLNDQFKSLIESVPHYVDGVMAWGNDLYGRYSDILGDEQIKGIFDSVQGSFGEWASSLASMSASGIVNVGAGAANAVTAIGFALVIAFWIIMALPALGREVKRIAGSKHAEDLAFLHFTFTRVMGGYIKGTLIQCLIIGVACGVLFTVIGVPNAAAIGGITGVLNILPIIGPWLGGGAAAIMALFASPLSAIIALAGTIVIQQVVYTFISPKIMGDSVEIHPALMIFALMCGSAIGGTMSGMLGALVGMLVSIPAVAVLKACFAYWFEKRTGRSIIASDGVFFQGDPAKTHKAFIEMEREGVEAQAVSRSMASEPPAAPSSYVEACTSPDGPAAAAAARKGPQAGSSADAGAPAAPPAEGPGSAEGAAAPGAGSEPSPQGSSPKGSGR